MNTTFEEITKDLAGFKTMPYKAKLELMTKYNLDGFFATLSNTNNEETGHYLHTIYNNKKDFYEFKTYQEVKKRELNTQNETVECFSFCPNSEDEFKDFVVWFLGKHLLYLNLFEITKLDFIDRLNRHRAKDIFINEEFEIFHSRLITQEWAFEYIEGKKFKKVLFGNQEAEFKYFNLGRDIYLKGETNEVEPFRVEYFNEINKDDSNSSFGGFEQKFNWFLQGYYFSEYFVFLKEEKEYYAKNEKFKCLETENESEISIEAKLLAYSFISGSDYKSYSEKHDLNKGSVKTYKSKYKGHLNDKKIIKKQGEIKNFLIQHYTEKEQKEFNAYLNRIQLN